MRIGFLIFICVVWSFPAGATEKERRLSPAVQDALNMMDGLHEQMNEIIRK